MQAVVADLSMRFDDDLFRKVLNGRVEASKLAMAIGASYLSGFNDVDSILFVSASHAD